jgi:hypothetical protein
VAGMERLEAAVGEDDCAAGATGRVDVGGEPDGAIENLLRAARGGLLDEARGRSAAAFSLQNGPAPP